MSTRPYPPTLVFDDSTCNSLGVVRALGRQGIEVHLATCQTTSWAQKSRYVRQIHRLDCSYSESAKVAEFLNKLPRFGREKTVLIPTGDEILLSLAHASDLTREDYLLMAPPLKAVDTCVKKDKFYAAMNRLDIPVPITHYPETTSELDAIAESLTYDAIVKPTLSYNFWRLYGKKNYAFHSKDEYGLAKRELEKNIGGYVLQEFLHANEIYMCHIAMDNHGEPLSLCGYDKIRQFAGSGSYCVSKSRKELIDMGIAALRAINFHGIAEPEFIRDPTTGQFKLIEINARTTTQNRLSAVCGADLDFLYFKHLMGEELSARTTAFTENLSWMSEHEDLASVLSSDNVPLSQWLKEFWNADAYATLAKDDVMPSLSTIWLMTKVVISKMRKNLLLG